MATLTINGRKVTVDDSFLSLSPEQQDATVDEIAAEMGATGAPQQSGFTQLMAGADPATLERSKNVEMAVPPTQSPLPGVLGGFNDFSNAVQSGFNQGLTFGFGDELYAGVAAPFAAAGSMLGGGEFDLGKAFNEQLELTRKVNAERSGANPIASAAGEVTGAIVNPLSRISGGMVKSGLTGLGIGGAYGFGTGETMDERLSGMGLGAAGGGVLGAAAPKVAGWVGDALTRRAQRGATNAAIQGAPAAADLKTAASSMFQQLDQSGAMVSNQRFGQTALDLIRKFTKMRANPKLDPKAIAALEELVLAANEAQKAGTGITLSELHTLRQIAQKAAQSTEGRDQMFSTQIINALDDMIENLKPADMIGGADPTQAANLMFDAIGTWGRSKRVGIIENAIEQAQNTASGFENGLRVEFRKLLRPNMRKQFSDAEIQAIEEVVRGTTAANLLKLLGKFGFGGGNAANMMGGTVGGLLGGSVVAGGNPLGGIALAALGTVARKGSEKLTQRAANRAAQVVATPGVPSVAAGPKTLAAKDALRRLGLVGAPALTNEITIYGGNPALSR
jgi:hypothetical protein